MSTPFEHQGIAGQHEVLWSAVSALQGKLDSQQVRLTAELSALRSEIEDVACRLDALRAAPAAPGREDTAPQPLANSAGQASPPPPPHSEFGRPAPAGAPPEAASTGIEETLLGPELAAIEALRRERGMLIQGVRQQEPSAMTLAGQLLVFRGASPERRPQLVKDIGEAYCRWRRAAAPAHDLFRQQLTAYLTSQCEASGFPVQIELVQVGDRYDAKRHNAKQRGVEVIEAQGWVVLRSDGKVYTKANVVLK